MSMEHRCLFQAMRSDVCEPWGYVAPVIAAVVTRATGVLPLLSKDIRLGSYVEKATFP